MGGSVEPSDTSQVESSQKGSLTVTGLPSGPLQGGRSCYQVPNDLTMGIVSPKPTTRTASSAMGSSTFSGPRKPPRFFPCEGGVRYPWPCQVFTPNGSGPKTQEALAGTSSHKHVAVVFLSGTSNCLVTLLSTDMETTRGPF